MDFIEPYTLKGKDKTHIDFMCITRIGPTTSWFELVELFLSLTFPWIQRGIGAMTHTSTHDIQTSRNQIQAVERRIPPNIW